MTIAEAAVRYDLNLSTVKGYLRLYRAENGLLLAELPVDGPLQCIVSDMTAFYVKGVYHELTLYMVLWNNEIVSHSLSTKRGDRMTYISGLHDLIE